MFLVDPSWLIYAALLFVVGAIAMYTLEKVPMEYVSIGILTLLMVFFYFFPVLGPSNENLLRPATILAGFANPALIAVMALLVVGQGMVNTRALDQMAQSVFQSSVVHPAVAMVLSLFFVLSISAFLNNTPVVVIFIPIMQALAAKLNRSPSMVMMPLSFAAMLGGMTTLIGSSTNLLVSSSLIELSQRPFSFFEFTVPGMVSAAIGLVYVIFIAPRLLTDRATLANTLISESGKQFIAQITVLENSKRVGEEAKAGVFPGLRGIPVRVILRGWHAALPTFDGFFLRPGDVLIVAATRKALTDVLARGAGVLHTEHPDVNTSGDEEAGEGDQILSEVMVTPASRLIGQNLEQIGFRYKFNSIVLGLQRRSRMIRARMTEIPLEAGDVLLIQGATEDIESLRAHRDLLPMEWSASGLPSPKMARRANIIFFSVIALAALEIIPIVVAALLGAAAMIYSGVLNIRQAGRAIDRNLLLMVAASLALGATLQATGAAGFLAQGVIDVLGWSHPALVLSAFFLMVAMLSNVISNNACAVLFTPIAVNIAIGLGVDPVIFAIAVVFGANCSFATPVGYQTNLLVMGPGHYRFTDFIRAGLPLTIILWLVFSFFAPWYYGI